MSVFASRNWRFVSVSVRVVSVQVMYCQGCVCPGYVLSWLCLSTLCPVMVVSVLVVSCHGCVCHSCFLPWSCLFRLLPVMVVSVQVFFCPGCVCPSSMLSGLCLSGLCLSGLCLSGLWIIPAKHTKHCQTPKESQRESAKCQLDSSQSDFHFPPFSNFKIIPLFLISKSFGMQLKISKQIYSDLPWQGQGVGVKNGSTCKFILASTHS